MADATKQFNSQEYKFEIKFLPYGSKEVQLNPDSVVQLVLEEQILFWATKGFLMIQNFNEMFQREIKAKDIINSEIPAKQKQQLVDDQARLGYIFRNDGKDRVSIKIKPIKSPFSQDPDVEEPPDTGWLIDFIGNIYDFEEPMVSDFGSKVKKIYFWDEDWQKLKERNCYNKTAEGSNNIWSTATSKLNPNYGIIDPAQATDEQRKMFTGDAIRDIFENTMGFEIDENNFDKGKSKIFHTAPVGSNCWDNIYYLWTNHLSESQLPSQNFDISIIMFDDDNKKYQFMPLSKIFEKAGNIVEEPGEYQIEHLIIEDVINITDSKDKTVKAQKVDQVWMAPILKQYDPEYQRDVKIHKLKKYSFTEMSAVDSIRTLVTHSIFAYDRKNKTFSKNTKKSQIKDLPKYLQEDYIDGLFWKKGQDNTSINLNAIKNENIKTKYKFTPISNVDVVERLGHGNLILKSILYNLCLTVELEGSTNRKVGRFIGVDRFHNNENEFDYHVGGQWLVVRVQHNFFRNTYVNEINLVKHHVYDKITFNKDENVE